MPDELFIRIEMRIGFCSPSVIVDLFHRRRREGVDADVPVLECDRESALLHFVECASATRRMPRLERQRLAVGSGGDGFPAAAPSEAINGPVGLLLVDADQEARAFSYLFGEK